MREGNKQLKFDSKNTELPHEIAQPYPRMFSPLSNRSQIQTGLTSYLRAKAHAESLGMSLNAYINKLIDEDMKTPE